jgi:hypothetical protein
MGLVKEPEGIDFVIQSKPLTTKQEKELSEFIAKRKLEIKKRLKKTRSRKILNPERPLSDSDDLLVKEIARGLMDVKNIREGKAPKRTIAQMSV